MDEEFERARTEYFARVGHIEPKGEGLDVHVENNGQSPLPVGWVRATGAVTPSGYADEYGLDVLQNAAVVQPGETMVIGTWSLAGWGDGAYAAKASLVVTDDQGSQVCLDNSDEIKFSVLGGAVTPYREDAIGDAELGGEFPSTADIEFNVEFEPIPYVEANTLVVSIRNDGPLSLPVATVVHVAMDGDPADLVLDREVPAGDRWAGSFDLPDLPAGNHSAMFEGVIDPAIFEGRIPQNADLKFSFWCEVCYQDDGPVDVLIR